MKRFKIGDHVVITNLDRPSGDFPLKGKIGHRGVVVNISSTGWHRLQPMCPGGSWYAENLEHEYTYNFKRFYQTLVLLLMVTCATAADFRTAYSVVRSHEGNYSNLPYDMGGETYGGISRVHHPTWEGWRYIDLKQRGWNEKVDEAEFWVQDFYLTEWIRGDFGKLKDQRIANYLFDFMGSGPIAKCITQDTIIELGGLAHHRCDINLLTINEINRLGLRFLISLANNRIKHYTLQSKVGDNYKFKEGWIRRATFR